MNNFVGVYCCCPVCQKPLVVSIELLEWSEIHRPDENDGELTDTGVVLPDMPFPVGLDLDEGGLAFLGWCSECRGVKIAVITPDELIQMLEDEQKQNPPLN